MFEFKLLLVNAVNNRYDEQKHQTNTFLFGINIYTKWKSDQLFKILNFVMNFLKTIGEKKLSEFNVF